MMKRTVKSNVRLLIEKLLFQNVYIRFIYLLYTILFFLKNADEDEDEDDVVKDDLMDESESSIQNVNKTNTNESIVDIVLNDDSIIPETQDVLSQDSVASLSHSQSDIEPKSGLEQSQSNLSVVSISSHEVTQIKAADEKINLDENRRETTFGKWNHNSYIYTRHNTIYFLCSFVYISFCISTKEFIFHSN